MIFQAVIPSINRPAITHQILGAKAVIIQPIAEPTTLQKSIFFLQNLSESLPRYGAEIKLQSAYTAPTTPTIIVETQNRSINDGRMGKIIVRPMRSSAIVRKIARFGFVIFFFIRSILLVSIFYPKLY